MLCRNTSFTQEELAHIKTPHVAAAPVEEEPCGSGSKRRKIHVDPIARDWCLDMLDQWRTEHVGEAQRLCVHTMGVTDVLCLSAD